MNAPHRVSPEQLPDPWLLDTEGLLSELARIPANSRSAFPPVRNDIIGPINSLIDGVWDLEQRLRYCLHLHCEGQRAFARQHDKKLAKRHGSDRSASTTHDESLSSERLTSPTTHERDAHHERDSPRSRKNTQLRVTPCA